MAKITFPIETPPIEGEAIEIADGILWIRLPLPIALDHVNVYALRENGGWCIVDTGYHSKRGVALWEKLLAGPLGGDPVHRVLLTHHHPDHVGMVGWFQSQKGSELLATRTTWLYARMLTVDIQEQWPQETLDFYLGAGMPADLFDARKAARPFNFADSVHPMPLGFTRIQDGQELRLGGRDWVVRTGDGHSPEHATLWCAADNLVLAGDQILPGISPNVGVYPTEPMADPLTEWLHSCEKLLVYANDDQLVLAGHKLPFRGLPLRLEQLIANHHAALPRLLEFLQTPNTAVGCFPVLFKRKIGQGEYGLAMAEAIAHLNHLLLQDKVSREKNDQGHWLWSAK
ncbi:MBL fold hydrolase [Amylibacter marinus]|uniref:MBL fold hydrolase n=1 Tax=Amylibacter marinus TaxID=1475483 RepID=A0ABQ5VWV4_9RHOB|nr:MBL fold metallo-hydrolase [Amylibacter marinus]GLQ35900.1 MBL fold hydrolase [Amylibacter marinus]